MTQIVTKITIFLYITRERRYKLLTPPGPVSPSTNTGVSLRWLVSRSIALNRLPTGLVIPAVNRGFCRNSADPDRGSPAMK